jgi:hypothetical protein
MKRGKAYAEQRHACIRAYERYGVMLSPGQYEALCTEIRERRSVFVRKHSNTRTVHDVEHRGKTMRAVYDKLRKRIVTFLPL